jgi:hypothetical protein
MMRRTSPRTSRIVHVEVRLERVEAVEVVLPRLAVECPRASCSPGNTMPLFQCFGRFFDHTYQSRYASRALRASWNHGCSFDVWLTTRSISTLMPFFFAWCMNSTKSPLEP